MELGTVLFRLSDPFNVHHFRRVCQHLRSQKSRASAPWVSAYLRHFRSSHRCHTSSPASRPSAAILTTHVTGGGRGRRVRKGRGLTPSARRPGPVKSRALRPGCDWARYLEALIGFEEGRTPVGPPPARPSSPASAICEPGSLVLASRGKRGPVLAHECGCAGFSSGHLR